MKAFVWVLGICAVFFMLIYLFQDNIRRLVLSNKVIVQTRSPVDHRLVRIDWTAEVVKDTITIFSGGNETNEIFEAPGFNSFLMYYNGNLLAEFEQFKRTAITPHTYTFQLWYEGDSVYTDLKIFGPDANL